MEFPTIVYRVPGRYKAPGGKGKTFDYRGCRDKSEYDNLLVEGWFETIGHAQAREKISDTPTRAELEAKATELGIRFDGRTGDKKLGQLIQDRLSAPTGE